jgi:hypothetical protein
MAIGLGGLMTDPQCQEPPTRLFPNKIEPPRGSMSASVAGSEQEMPDHRLETEYDAHLRSLQQYICELLIKNQQLRLLLQSAANHQKEEFANE